VGTVPMSLLGAQLSPGREAVSCPQMRVLSQPSPPFAFVFGDGAQLVLTVSSFLRLPPERRDCRWAPPRPALAVPASCG
jgi:hypothetical protein